jgi:formylglycine-generating enzyme required for sulfatase activity
VLYSPRGIPVQPDGPGGVTQPPLVRGETASAEREAAPLVQRCPRCAAQIEGDYRFCPSCAYRLRAGTDPEPQAPSAPPWKRGFVVAAGLAAVLGALLIGAIVFYPSWLPLGASGSQPTTPIEESASYAEPAFTVASIRDQIVELPAWGYVTAYSLDALPLKGPEEVEKVEALRKAHPEMESLPVLISYPLPIMKYEVTQGQYEEFLRDVAEHPDRAPQIWVSAQRGATKPQDVRLWSHIPEPWITRDKDGEPVSWRVDPVHRNLPVTNVSYYDAWAFAAWASKRLGMAFALPNEMEWTRAARAGHLTVPRPGTDQTNREEWRWPWGSELLIYACNNSQFWPDKGRPEYVHFVYSEPRGGDGGATPDGLFAMAGNVGEWAIENEIVLYADLESETVAYIHPAPIEDTSLVTTALAMGGSFRDGIDDCQVDSKSVLRKIEKSDESGDTYTRRDNVGFRLVVRK